VVSGYLDNANRCDADLGSRAAVLRAIDRRALLF
jgi:hypothetical protein